MTTAPGPLESALAIARHDRRHGMCACPRSAGAVHRGAEPVRRDAGWRRSNGPNMAIAAGRGHGPCARCGRCMIRCGPQTATFPRPGGNDQRQRCVHTCLRLPVALGYAWAWGISTCELWESWRCAPRWAAVHRDRKKSCQPTSRRSPIRATPASNWRLRRNRFLPGLQLFLALKTASAPKTNGRPRQQWSFSGLRRSLSPVTSRRPLNFPR
jgi:hypothetical protein